MGPDARLFDVILASYSVHHLAPNEKRRFFELVGPRLSGGGVFVSAIHKGNHGRREREERADASLISTRSGPEFRERPPILLFPNSLMSTGTETGRGSGGFGGLPRAAESIEQKTCPREECQNHSAFQGVFAKNQRAGEGTRTLDIQLGKLALYQLSYARDAVPS